MNPYIITAMPSHPAASTPKILGSKRTEAFKAKLVTDTGRPLHLCAASSFIFPSMSGPSGQRGIERWHTLG